MSAGERIAYLKGLVEGLNPDDADARKIYQALIDALEGLADEINDQAGLIEEQQEMLDELSEYCAQLEDDLFDLEEEIHGEVEEGVEEGLFEPEEGEEEEDLFATATCPGCGHTFYFQPDEYQPGEDLQCPGCGREFPVPQD